ncbi:hypothetical protein DFS34DRAFT_650459 [Phlyctochytrium arcticum]|nr:hypothetical protein DFS34DRAFT_650459 [Phlyctochytrium arcticum]
MTFPSERESPEALALWSEAQVFERELYEYKVRKRQKRTTDLNVSNAENLRLSVLGIYEDLLLTHPAFSVQKNVDEKLWTSVFYARIEASRSLIRTNQGDANVTLTSALETLQNNLDTAISFYQGLLLSLRGSTGTSLVSQCVEYLACPSEEDVSSPEEKDLVATRILIYKSLVSLGDLYRYREAHSVQEVKSWSLPQMMYLKAIKCNPHHGKSYSQLAILASYGRSDIDPAQLETLRGDKGQYRDFSQSPRKEFKETNVSIELATVRFHILHLVTLFYRGRRRSLMEQLTTQFLDFHQKVFLTADQETGTADLLGSFSAIKRMMVQISASFSQNTPLPDWLKLAVPVLIAAYHYLDEQFTHAEDASHRQYIRVSQVLYASLLLDTVVQAIDIILEGISETDLAVESVADEGGLNPLFQYLVPVNLICIWLGGNLEVFALVDKYTKTMSEAPELAQTSLRFFRSLCKFTNVISAFTEMDGSTECLREDVLLLGFSPLRSYYQLLDKRSVLDALQEDPSIESQNNQIAVQLSRIALLIKQLSESQSTDIIKFDETEGVFVVLDEKSKNRGKQKFMKALATERLKDQVSTLEKRIIQMKEISRPMILPDADCFVNNLGLIKKWLVTRACIIIVSLDVIDDLDRLKKGTEKQNARARETIRYLEQRFRYRSEYLKAQQTEERTIAWDRHGQIENRSTVVNRNHREFLACALYYQSNVAPQPLDGRHRPFSVLSDSEELLSACSELGIAATTSSDWAKFVDKDRQSKK